ncbi:MAG: peptide deformylase [Syntrophobacteraceae bacterium]|jgi:peptide deformylase|nr:peptide deformylase [Syntrophobacteraceae bacterium]
MACLQICTYPDPILRRKAEPVTTIDRDIHRLIDEMAETMYSAPGIGLAANQVGKAQRVLVVDLQRPEYDRGLLVLVNPKIVAASGETTYEEGCLSVPEFFSNVKRYEQVTVQAMDKDGNPVEVSASGLLAVVLQHEIDHLEGRLFIDHLGTITRELFKRKWKKRLKEDKA